MNELADLLSVHFKLQESLVVGLNCSDAVQLGHVLFYQLGQDIMLPVLWVRRGTMLALCADVGRGY